MRRRLFMLIVVGLATVFGCGRSGGDPALDEAVDLADRAWARGDTAQTRGILEEALATRPKSFPLLYRLAVLTMETDPTTALRSFTSVSELDPEHPGPVFYAGMTRLRLNDYNGAERDLRRGYRLGLARRGYALEDTSEAGARGLNSLALGRFPEAAEYFTNALATDSGNAVLWLLKGKALAGAGQQDSAAVAVARALKARPRFPAALAVRGELFLANQALGPARDDLTEALEASPDLAWAHYQFARLHLAENEYRTAALDLWHAVLADPTVPQPHQLLGQVFMRMEQGSQAMTHYQHYEWVTGFLQRYYGPQPGRR